MSDYNQKHIKKNLSIGTSTRREPSPINIRADLQEGFAKLEKQQEKQRQIRFQESVQIEEPTQLVQEPKQTIKKPETPQDIKVEAKKKQIAAAKKSKEDAALMERRGLTGSVEEERLSSKVKSLGKIPMAAGILGSGGAALAGMVKNATSNKIGDVEMSSAADIAGSLIPGLGMLGGLSMGLSKTQQAQRIRSAKQSENQLGATGKVSQVAGSASMLSRLPFTAAGIAGMMTGDPTGAMTKVGKVIKGGVHGGMQVATETVGSGFSGASKLAGKVGLDTTSSMLSGASGMAGGLSGMIASSPILAPALAMALPGIISGISSVVIAKKRMRIRGKPSTKERFIKEFGQSRIEDGYGSWTNRILLDPKMESEDRILGLVQIILDSVRNIAASVSVLPQMAVMARNKELKETKGVNADISDIDKLKEKWAKTEIGGISVTLGKFTNDVVDKFTLFSQKLVGLDPFKQVTDLLFKGKTPLTILNEQEELHGSRIEQDKVIEKVKKELGIRHSDAKLLSMSGSAIAQMAETPDGKKIALLSAIKDITTLGVMEQGAIRAHLGISSIDLTVRPVKKKGFLNMLNTIGMSIPIVATATAIISTAVKTIPKVIKFPGEMYSQFKGFLKKRRDSEVKVFKELAEKQQKLFEKEGIAVSDEKAAQIYFAGPFQDVMGDMKRIGWTQVELLQNIFAVAKQQFEMLTGSTFVYQETQAARKQQMVYDTVTGQYVLPSEYQEILTERLEKAEKIQSEFISSQFKSQRKEAKARAKLEKFRLKDIEKTGTTDLQSMDEIKAQSFKQIESGAIGRIDTKGVIPSGFGQLQTGFGDFVDVIKDKFTYTYVVVADKIYKVEMEDKEDNEDIFEASRESDGTISFTVKYYNGGCGFNEAIEEAFKLMDVKKAKV